MADAALLYAPRVFFVDANGDPLSGGKLFTYEPGTTTDKTTYAEQSLTTPLANPIILDANGSAVVWLDGIYKFDLTDSDDVQIDGYPVDNFSTAPAATPGTLANLEWGTTGDVVTFIDADEFSVPNDKTTTYQVGRRARCTVTAGTVYGYISASSFAASITTVTVVLDSGNLDSGLSVVDVGILSVTNPSIPSIADATIGTQAAAANQVSSGELISAADTGAADVYAMAPAVPILAYTTRMTLVMTIANANLTTTPTIELHSLGAKTIKREDGAALLVGDLPAGYIAVFRYDGTDMILTNPALVVNHDHADAAGGGGNLTPIDVTVTGSAASPPDTNTLVKDNIIKFWANFNGTGTPAYIDSYNVTGSITDNGAGDYTLTINTDFADTNYAVFVSAFRADPDRSTAYDNKLVGSVDVRVGVASTGGAADSSSISVLAIGGQ